MAPNPVPSWAMGSKDDEPRSIAKIVKIAVLALVLIVLILSAIDGLAIVRAGSHLNKVAQDAATAASAAYRAKPDIAAACAAATTSIVAAIPGFVVANHRCKIDTTAGTVSIKMHNQASTIFLGLIPYVRRITVVKGSGSSTVSTAPTGQ
jgi:hypothetical protein